MEWEEVEKRLIRLLGPNYFNYPQCMEWNIMIMKYLAKSKELEKVENDDNNN
jgi:hypothetical protein